MTRIGLAYNQKPDTTEPAPRDTTRADDEPPSVRGGGGVATLVAPHASPAVARKNGGGDSVHGRGAGAGAAGASYEIAIAAGTAGGDGVSLGEFVGSRREAAGDDEFAEWDAPETINAIENALAALGEVVRLEATDDFPDRLREERPDIVFNIAEGLRGPNRESHIPAICEFYGVPYTASDPFTLALCLDKARTKEVLRARAVATAPAVLIEHLNQLRDASFPPFPLFAKPVHEGSSKGITERNFCRDRAQLNDTVDYLLSRYEQPVIVEAYLPGDEFTCAVLGNGATARVLPIVGMNFDSLPAGALPIYGFEAKWMWDRPERPLQIFECPARIGTGLARAIERVTLAAYHALGCRDWSRIDVRLDAGGAPNVVEVNPLPGILPDPEDNSCFPKAARAAGMNYDQLIQTCLRHGAERQGVHL